MNYLYSVWSVSALILFLSSSMIIGVEPAPESGPRPGTIVVWSDYGYSPYELPPDLFNVEAIALSKTRLVALKNDSTVYESKISTSGDMPPPQGLSNVVQVAAGTDHTLALLADGTVVSWGRTNRLEYPNAVPDGLSNVIQIVAGDDFSLALKGDGTVTAWGPTPWGITNLPPSLTNVSSLAASESHVVALRHDGTVLSWGVNFNGRTQVPEGLSNVVAVAAGRNVSGALRSDGVVVPWGLTGSIRSVLSATNAVSLVASDMRLFLLLSDGSIRVSEGELPPGLAGVTALSAAGSEMVAVVAAGLPAPLITYGFHPRTDRLTFGDTIYLTAAASGTGPLTIEWFKDGILLAGLTNTSVALTNAELSHAGVYTMRVTDQTGSSMTQPITVEVVASYFEPALIRPYGFWYRFRIGANQHYRLQTSTNLQAWSDITNYFRTDSRSARQDLYDTNTTTPRRFYRLVSP